MRPMLIATKVRPPTIRDQVIPRERLVERLRAGSGLALTLVICPAGFGKTTLLAEWYQAETARKPVAWLTLDEGDNDPVVLWSYVIEALRQVCPAVSVPPAPHLCRTALCRTAPGRSRRFHRRGAAASGQRAPRSG